MESRLKTLDEWVFMVGGVKGQHHADLHRLYSQMKVHGCCTDATAICENLFSSYQDTKVNENNDIQAHISTEFSKKRSKTVGYGPSVISGMKASTTIV